MKHELVGHIITYTPFTHYRIWDFLRVLYVALAITNSVPILMLAGRRWKEHRLSASYFLVALVAFMIEDALGSIYALGHPVTYVLFIRLGLVILTGIAITRVFKEISQGDWRKVDERQYQR